MAEDKHPELISIFDESRNIPDRILAPDTAFERPKKQPQPKPVCPSCGAKFQHSNDLAACKVCGLPDEVRVMGDYFIQRWRKDNHVGRMLRHAKKTDTIAKGGSANKRRKKHGRR